MRKFVPLILFLGLVIAFGFGLMRNPALIPSVLLNKPVPEFTLPALENLNRPALSSYDLKNGKISIVNIWASWCVPCRQEQPLLLELAKRVDVQVVGINNKDDPENARNFLANNGNPFSAIGSDLNGRVTIDFGAYGVPETFIVDGKGVIRFKVIGGLTADYINRELPQQIQQITDKQ